MLVSYRSVTRRTDDSAPLVVPEYQHELSIEARRFFRSRTLFRFLTTCLELVSILSHGLVIYIRLAVTYSHATRSTVPGSHMPRIPVFGRLFLWVLFKYISHMHPASFGVCCQSDVTVGHSSFEFSLIISQAYSLYLSHNFVYYRPSSIPLIKFLTI